jgi:hypothetical protein
MQQEVRSPIIPRLDTERQAQNRAAFTPWRRTREGTASRRLVEEVAKLITDREQRGRQRKAKDAATFSARIGKPHILLPMTAVTWAAWLTNTTVTATTINLGCWSMVCEPTSAYPYRSSTRAPRRSKANYLSAHELGQIADALSHD